MKPFHGSGNGVRAWARRQLSWWQNARGPEHSRRDRNPGGALPWLLGLALILWALCNWYSTLQHISRYYVAIPVSDYWRVAEDVPAIENLDLRVLWRQHNEHRIVFPELIFALDVLLAHGRRVLPVAVSLACYGASWLLLARSLLSEKQCGRFAAVVGISLAACVMGWKGSALALADPFLLQWTLLEFGVLFSLFCLPRASEISHRGTSALVGAITAGIIATYSSGNGLLLWPILLVAGLATQLPRGRMLALALSAALTSGLYFAGYHASAALDLARLLTHPAYAAGFVATYLGMPFGNMKSPHFAVAVGAFNFGLSAALFFAAWKRRLLASRTGILFLGWYIFNLASVLLTAAGRMEPGDIYFGNARAVRYLTMPFVTWGVLLMLLCCMAGRRGPRLLFGIVVSAAVVLSIGFFKLRWWFDRSQIPYQQAQLAELAVQNRVLDPALLGFLFPDPSFVLRYLPVLERWRLSAYAPGSLPERMAGRSFRDFAWREESSGSSRTTARFSAGSASGLVGWAKSETQGTTEVLVADETGQIIGVGHGLPAGWPPGIPRSGRPDDISWVAFIPRRVVFGKLSVYVVQPGRKSKSRPELLRVPGCC